jgi:hypothetical protein
MRWYFDHNGRTADMDELTVFQYFVKFHEFGGLQNAPNRFENRFHKVFIIREICEIRGLTSVFGINLLGLRDESVFRFPSLS